MDKDNSDLIEYLDQKFTKIDDRFDSIDQKFIRIDERFGNVDQKFTHIDERFDEMKKDFIDLQSSVDAYAKKADTYFQEMVMLAHKVDRLEKWIFQIAKVTGIKLEE
jgi:archaellum component FlaC